MGKEEKLQRGYRPRLAFSYLKRNIAKLIAGIQTIHLSDGYLVALKQERAARLELEIKQNHLRHWLQEIKPVWDQLKNKIEHPELPEVTSLEQHFTNLDKICSIPSVK